MMGINPNEMEKVSLCSHFNAGAELSPWKELSSTIGGYLKKKKKSNKNPCHTTAHTATAFN